MSRKEALLSNIRNGLTLSRSDQIRLVGLLSVPACLGQLSTIAMQYIDAMMVGQLGAEASAGIGLVSTTTWLFGGLCHSLMAGFCVLVSHKIGAREDKRARSILSQSIILALLLSLTISVFCFSIHNLLPIWLGGRGRVAELGATYFGIWSLCLPIMQLLFLSNGMLRSSGDMKIPMISGIGMCLLDVVFNFIFIPLWGVAGAAVATGLAGMLTMLFCMYNLVIRSEHLAIVGHVNSKLRLHWDTISGGVKIGTPMAVEHVVFCLAQIVVTLIVAPLGTVAIAANAFGIVVESLCYMPGYGIGDAATTLIGQSTGARRTELVRSFSWITTGTGVLVMSLLGMLMFVFSPELMTIMTPDHSVRLLGSQVLRIEAFAEPMYAASIVIYGVFMGTGKTLVPCVMNLFSIWCVRIPLAFFLSREFGLWGVWIAMAAELTFRGLMFIAKLAYNNSYNSHNPDGEDRG